MQAMKTPESVVLPFMTIHFLTNPSADNVKTIDDLPNAVWKFVHTKTAEYADLYLRFDLTKFKMDEVEKERGASLMYDAILNAVRNANFEDGSGLYDIYTSSGTSGAMVGFKSPHTEIMNTTWNSMCRMVEEQRIGGSANSFSAITGDDGIKKYGLALNLGNGHRIFISKSDPAYQSSYRRRNVTGSIALFGDRDYIFNVAGEYWLDAVARDVLKFVSHDDIVERTNKALRALFGGVLTKEDIDMTLMDMKFDK
jgi:hypothetical protein